MIKGIEHIFTGSPQAIAITSLTRQGDSIFCGLTSGPEALVRFDIKENKFTQSYNVFPWANDTEQIVLRKIHNSLGTLDDGRISTWAFHNMVIKNGIVYGAWIDTNIEEKLRVLRFDPAKGYLERLSSILLDDPGPRVQGNKGIDQWMVHSNGDIYVGTAGGGTLYRFDEKELTLEKIGQIGHGGRVTSLDEDENGRVIFTSGFPKMSIGRYNPATKKLEDFGPITDKYDKIYFHGSVYKDGILYLAETDSGVASLWEVPMP